MIYEKTTRDTLLAIEMDLGDELRLTLSDGSVRRIEVLETRAKIHSTTLKEMGKPEPSGRTVARMHVVLRIDGHRVELVRWLGSQRSFYEPWNLLGLRLWFDASAKLFDHFTETHAPCKPRKAVRLAMQEASRRICPVLLHPWCPLPEGGLRIEECYDGGDCWMGPYYGCEAHGGLDINHPAGTPIWTPVSIDDHGYFASIANGDPNNRWRGIHRWPDGSAWLLQVHHVLRLLQPEHTPLPAGAHLADGAGVLSGSHEHSHFYFRVQEPGVSQDEAIALDPWILFWQMYQDRKLTSARG